MTGGTAVILGKTGRLCRRNEWRNCVCIDEKKQFENGLCNMEMVALETLDDDLSRLKRLIKNHSMYTNSPLAKSFG
jgi:glutamate synthase (ferredoxin)